MSSSERSDDRIMRLGIDARIFSGKMCGIARYVLLILDAVAQDPTVEVVLFTDTHFHPMFGYLYGKYRVIERTGSLAKRSWVWAVLPFLLMQERIDVYHATANGGMPRWAHCPCVLTVYDLFLFTRSNVSAKRKRRKRKEFESEIGRANMVFCISAYTKAAVSAEIRASREDRLSVTLLDCDRAGIMSATADVAEFPKEINDFVRGKRYFVMPAGRVTELRKNVLRMSRAFADVARQRRDTVLCIVGTSDETPTGKEIGAFVAEHPAIRIFSGVDDADLYRLMSRCAGVFFVTEEEGFGLPILEGFVAGAPVVTADRSASAEVAGDAALTVDPVDTEGMTAALLRLLDDEVLRDGCVTAGKKRAEMFDWRKKDGMMVDVYHAVAGGYR